MATKGGEFDYRECLTNERLLKRFSSQFELVRYAIKIAEEKVHSGHEEDFFNSGNTAYEILAEIADGRIQLKDIDADRTRLDPIVDKFAVKETKKEAGSKRKAKA